jgi:hypothetical protein
VQQQARVGSNPQPNNLEPQKEIRYQNNFKKLKRSLYNLGRGKVQRTAK